MESKQRRFSKVKAYQIVCRLGEIALRNFVNKRPSLRSWSDAAKRQYQSLSHQAKVCAAADSEHRVPDEWHLAFLDMTRSVNKMLENSHKTWQRRAFEILEVLNKPEVFKKPQLATEWSICTQVVTSHNHFLKNDRPMNMHATETWQRVVWRIERLNYGEKKREDDKWKNKYRLILKYEFRLRKFGWERAASRTVEHLIIQVGNKVKWET